MRQLPLTELAQNLAVNVQCRGLTSCLNANPHVFAPDSRVREGLDTQRACGTGTAANQANLRPDVDLFTDCLQYSAPLTVTRC